MQGNGQPRKKGKTGSPVNTPSGASRRGERLSPSIGFTAPGQGCPFGHRKGAALAIETGTRKGKKHFSRTRRRRGGLRQIKPTSITITGTRLSYRIKNKGRKKG